MVLPLQIVEKVSLESLLASGFVWNFRESCHVNIFNSLCVVSVNFYVASLLFGLLEMVMFLESTLLGWSGDS